MFLSLARPLACQAMDKKAEAAKRAKAAAEELARREIEVMEVMEKLKVITQTPPHPKKHKPLVHLSTLP